MINKFIRPCRSGHQNAAEIKLIFIYYIFETHNFQLFLVISFNVLFFFILNLPQMNENLSLQKCS